LGHLRLAGQRLIASVNSQKRAERIRAEIEARLGQQVRYQASDIQSINSLLREAESQQGRPQPDDMESLSASPEVQQEVEQMLDPTLTPARYIHDLIVDKIMAYGILT
jgi:hypothetical protein